MAESNYQLMLTRQSLYHLTNQALKKLSLRGVVRRSAEDYYILLALLASKKNNIAKSSNHFLILFLISYHLFSSRKQMVGSKGVKPLSLGSQPSRLSLA
jgi:hypothetical protein